MFSVLRKLFVPFDKSIYARCVFLIIRTVVKFKQCSGNTGVSTTRSTAGIISIRDVLFIILMHIYTYIVVYTQTVILYRCSSTKIGMGTREKQN